MDKRKPEFDCIRALCMVWIVAVWHMAYYVPQISFVENSMMARKITNGVLATFMFCSGMFCGREGINNLQEVKNFYIKRFIRIYPLFFVSCVSMLILGSFSRRTFIFTVSGLAYITGERPLTIWFLSMLIFFYVLTPVIIYKKNKYRVFTKCVLILGLYTTIISSIKEVLTFNFSALPILIVFGLGVIIGILSTIKLIRHFLETARPQMIYLILGLMIGSIYAVIMGPTTLETAQAPMSFSTFNLVWFIIGGAVIIGLEQFSKLMEKKQE